MRGGGGGVSLACIILLVYLVLILSPTLIAGFECLPSKKWRKYGGCQDGIVPSCCENLKQHDQHCVSNYVKTFSEDPKLLGWFANWSRYQLLWEDVGCAELR